MNINIKATVIELTPALRQYVTDKLGGVEKYLGSNDGQVMAQVEIGKTTNHHKEGDYYRAEINLNYSGQLFRIEEVSADLYAAIDVAKDRLVEQLSQFTKKRNTLLRRGGRALKNLAHSAKKIFRRK